MICFWDFFALIFLQLPKLLPARLWKNVPTCRLSLPGDRLFVTFKKLFCHPELIWCDPFILFWARIKYDVQIIHLNLVCIWISLTKHCNSLEGKLLETWRWATSGPMFSLFPTSKERKAYFREEMTSLPTERVSWETCGSRVGGKYYLSSWSKKHKVGLLYYNHIKGNLFQ